MFGTLEVGCFRKSKADLFALVHLRGIAFPINACNLLGSQIRWNERENKK